MKKIGFLKSGFSLIELLVVVAIIGILAAVGIAGYQVYISQTRDATTIDNFEFLKRTLDQDILSLENDLSARSDFAENLSSASRCFQLKDRYIRDINEIRRNPFNQNKGQVCDGNHLTTHRNEEAGLVGDDVPSVTLSRGQTMVYCDGVDIRNASWKLVRETIDLKFCTCSGQETCPTTQRYKGTFVAGTASSAPFDNITVSRASGSKDNLTAGSQLLIGNQLVVVSGAVIPLGPLQDEIDVALEFTPSPGDEIYEVNPNICFTPPGEETITLYLSDFVSPEFSGGLPLENTCFE